MVADNTREVDGAVKSIGSGEHFVVAEGLKNWAPKKRFPNSLVGSQPVEAAKYEHQQ